MVSQLANNVPWSQLQPEHGFRRCLGILRLAKTYSPERLERACQLALQLGTMRYRNIKSILEKKLEQTEASEFDSRNDTPLKHDNIRGSDYYTGGLQ